MLTSKERVTEMENRLKRILKKENLSAQETNLLNYTSNLISFRIKMVTGKSFPTDKLLEKESEFLSHLTDEQIRALNLSILYKDVKRKVPRDEKKLRELQEKIKKKAP